MRALLKSLSWALFLLWFITCVDGASQEFLEKVCPNALAVGDPACQNGGTLHASNNSDYRSCAYCECPDNWTGVQCDMCTDPSYCPNKTLDNGESVSAVSCTSGMISPTPYEMVAGKKFSCFCGGPDETTAYACGIQPATSVEISILPQTTNASKEFDLVVLERAGTPSQDYTPPCYNPDGTKKYEPCLTKERYRYAYPQVWSGNFHSCTWKHGDCMNPMSGSDCIVYTCKTPKITCPPPYVEKCPGWTDLECGNPGDEPRPYWTHHCNPMTIPMSDVPMVVSCKDKPYENGTFQCYMSQPDVPFIASIGMQCFTGTCIYPEEGSLPDESGASDDTPLHIWITHHAEALMLTAMIILLLKFVVMAGVFIHKDNRRSVERVEEWAKVKRESVDVPLISSSNGAGLGDLTGSDLAVSCMENVQPIVFSFDNINYFVRGWKGEKHVLKDVTGLVAKDDTRHQFRMGCLMAIMGPSGAGKTSLLDILSGRKNTGVTGDVYVNSKKLKAGSPIMKKLSGYVQQEDVLPGTSTVFEYLLFHASLRLPPSIPQRQKEWRVFRIIQQLGLEKVCHNFIGDQFMRGLSGGEKRRVSIGCELLVGPGLMFLDEPTTGLDSTNASKVVDILSDMAATGVTVVMTIHQPRPDVFRTLDRVMLLSQIGQVVYSGPSGDAPQYFQQLEYSSPEKTVHIIDYMLDVVIRSDRKEVDLLVEQYKESRTANSEKNMAVEMNFSADLPVAPKFSPKFSKQIRCLSTRLVRNAIRHPVLIAVNFVANLIAALLLGTIFYNTGVHTEGIQSRLGVLFFILLFLSMMSLSSLPIWREEKLLFLRERSSGVYGTPAYFFSVLLFDLVPLRMLPPFFFSVLSYWMINLHENCASCILWFTLIIVLSNVVATLMSMMIGASMPSTAIANTVGSMVVMVFLLFGGFLLNKDNVPEYCRWIAKMSYFNYGYEALAVNEFMDAPVDFVFDAPVHSQELPPLRIKGKMVLCEFGFDASNFALDIAMLFLLGIICAVITYIILDLSSRGVTFNMLSLSRFKRIGRSKSSLESSQSSVDNPSEPLLDPNNMDSGEYEKLEDNAVTEIQTEIRENDNMGAVPGRPSQQWGVRFPSSELDMQLKPIDSIISLTWEQVSCTVTSSIRGKARKILDNVSGVAGPLRDASRPGSMLFAVMGPSGAGKTTLLDILAGRKRDRGVSGDIRINGRTVTARTTRKVSGYVLQDDVLPGTSTVFEYIMFHARLRLPSTLTQEQLKAHVYQICAQLGLEKVQESLIGDAFVRGLSGGEKRRVSIACELLVGPGLMFLDEPTTGLDSTNASKVVDILSDMAATGVTVVMTIHQPRPTFFSLMDRIMVLSGYGQVVYTGSTAMAERHLSSLGFAPVNDSINLADYMLDLIIKSPPQEVECIVQAYSSSQAANEDSEWRSALCARAVTSEGNESWAHFVASMKKYEASHCTQLKVLSSRMLRNLYRHPLLVLLNFLSSLCVSLGLGYIYFDTGNDTGGIQNRMGSLFFIAMYLSLMSLSSLPLWHEDRLLFVRERASGVYGTTSYFFAILLFDVLPMRILPPLLFGIAYWMIGLRMSFLATFLLVIVLANVVASTLSMAIGAAMPSTSIANMVGSLVILSDTLLGGFFLGRKQMGGGVGGKLIDILSRFSYIRYVFEALLINEFSDADGYKLTVGYRCVQVTGKSPEVPITGNEILETFGFPHSWQAYSMDIFVLFCFMAVHLVLTYLLFKYKNRPAERIMQSKGRNSVEGESGVPDNGSIVDLEE